jgi:glycosyltransferase involved in cell wall biosynthesis
MVAPDLRLSLAVVIPSFNEAARLAATLESLRAQSDPPDRVVVVDGGSSDPTSQIAEEAGTELLVERGRGRGGQVAAGVARVSEEVVLVAHGDMLFPPGALAAIRHALTAHPACPGGSLGHSFDSRRWIYRLIERADRMRAIRGTSYGDQAQFFRREWLARASGFPDQPIMEDVELSRRIRALGRPAYLDLPVTVSARRFEERGWWRVLWENWTFRRAYSRRGLAACRDIYERYYRRPWPYAIPVSAPGP